MGVVELVVRREGAFARAYARKRLLPEIAQNAHVRAMFLEEARIAGLVRHANVVSVLDVGEDEQGPFLVMDLVEGVSLATLIRRSTERGHRLPVQAAVDVAKQIADGLRSAHELEGSGGRRLDVVHRDVTPSNVIVGFDGVARLTDFGIVRALDRSEETRVGVLKGKYGYLTPEQLAFEDVDARADLYALGVVLYEMLAGARMRTGSRDEIFAQIVEAPPVDIGEVRDDVAPELVEIMFDLLQKDREARPRDAREVSARLATVLAALRAEEGPIDLGELVSSECAEERSAQREMVADAVHGAGEAARGDARVELHEQPTVLLEGTGPSSRGADGAPPRRGRGLVLAGALVLAAALVIAVVMVLDASSSEPAAVDDAAITVEPPAAGGEETSGEAPPEPHPERRVEAEPPPAPPEPDETAETEATPHRTSRAESRETTGSMRRRGMVPTWDWE
jgi:serine/threonine-protein kinase